MIIDEETYLDHYGVKGMRWGSTQLESLDRIYRVEAGTTTRRKKTASKQKRQNGSKKTKEEIDVFLEKVGAVRFIDIISPEE